jgi:hypothetical protein
MRRTHLRHQDNIAKRLLIHAGAFNLGLVMRKLSGCGTPRGLQGRLNQLLLLLLTLVNGFIYAITSKITTIKGSTGNIAQNRNVFSIS